MSKISIPVSLMASILCLASGGNCWAQTPQWQPSSGQGNYGAPPVNYGADPNSLRGPLGAPLYPNPTPMPGSDLRGLDPNAQLPPTTVQPAPRKKHKSHTKNTSLVGATLGVPDRAAKST